MRTLRLFYLFILCLSFSGYASSQIVEKALDILRKDSLVMLQILILFCWQPQGKSWLHCG